MTIKRGRKRIKERRKPSLQRREKSSLNQIFHHQQNGSLPFLQTICACVY
jgi:hypothetical protein